MKNELTESIGKPKDSWKTSKPLVLHKKTKSIMHNNEN